MNEIEAARVTCSLEDRYLMFVQVRRTPCVRYEVGCLHFVDRLAVDVTDTDFRGDDDQIRAGNQINNTDDAVDRTTSSSIDIG